MFVPTFSLQTDDWRDHLNVQDSLEYLFKAGGFPNKTLLGIPAYGRSFLLENSESGHGIRKPTLKKSFKVLYTRT